MSECGIRFKNNNITEGNIEMERTKIPKTGETRRTRFVRIAEGRVNRILEGLESLGKCSNRSNYDYSEEDVKKIFNEIEKKVKDIRNIFQGVSKNKQRFKL